MEETPTKAYGEGRTRPNVSYAEVERAAIALLKTERRPTIETIREAVSNRHGLGAADVRLLPAGAIPRTTSGKLARRACRAQYRSGFLGVR